MNNNLVFSSVSRASNDITALPSAQAAALNWRWDLVDSATPENVVLAGTAGTGTVTSIPTWAVAKTNFSTIGLRVRLQISTTTPLTGACAGKETSKSFTQALNGPDPAPITGGCTNGGPPCNFAVTSTSGVNMTADNWHFAWSATGPAAVAIGDDKPTYAPFFTATGNYTVSVTVTNAIGSKTVSTPVSVTTVGILCPQMNDFNMYPAYRNALLTCTISVNSGCAVGQQISFFPQAQGYDLGCAPHTFDWDFGDGGHSTDKETTHTYAAAGTYSIKMTVKNAAQTFIAQGQITVGTVVTPPVIPPTSKCPVMTAFNLYPTYRGTTEGCNSANQQTCGTGELIQFNVQPNSYDLTCDTHTFNWNFGDNSNGSGTSVSHQYSAPGRYTITLSASNSTQFNYTSTIQVTIGGSAKCPQMNALNLYPAYRNAAFTCSIANNSGCSTSEALSFFPQTSGYDLSCSTHTFDWDFGDSTAHSSSQSPNHQYTNAGPYTITLKVHNDQQDYTVTGSIVVSGNKAQPAPTVDFTAAEPDSSKPLLAVFTPSIDPANTVVTKVTWDFGDGSSPFSKPNLVQVTNLYAKSGTYVVTMTVESQGAPSATKTHAITVTAPSRSRSVRH